MKQTEEEFFKRLLSTSKLEMPFPDFEENIMSQIKQEKIHQQLLSRDIKLSWVFFSIMVLLGISISLMFTQLPSYISIIPSNSLKIAFELIFVVFVLIQIDSLIKYPFKGFEGHLKNHLRES